MKTMVLVIFLSIASLMAVPALAQEPSPQQNTARPSQALNNKDVLTMQNVGLGPDVIIAKIKSSTCDFDTSPAALEQLRAAKVPNEIILAMVQAPANGSAPATGSQSADAKNTMQHPGGYVGWFILPSAHGTLVITSVTPDSPVGRAGIQRGDVLVTVNGQPVTIADSQKIVALKVPGAQIKLGILRNGQEKEFTVTVDPLRATVTFVTVENGQVLKVAPKWALTWLGKNMEKYPSVDFGTSGHTNGEENYVIAFSFSSNALNGFQPVTHTNTSTSTSNISGGGAVTDNYGNSWDYTMNGQADTSTTTTTTTNEAYTRTYNGVYLTAYDAKGEIIGQERHVYSTQAGGNQGTALGYNMGNAFGAIHAKDHLMEAILKDIGLAKHN